MEHLFSILTRDELAQITSTKGLRRAIDLNEIAYIATPRPLTDLGISKSLIAECRDGEMTFEELGQKLILPTCDLCWDDKGASRNGLSKWAGSLKHPRCTACGVFFGGTHSGGMLPVPQAQRGMCRGCARKHLGLKFSVDTD